MNIDWLGSSTWDKPAALKSLVLSNPLQVPKHIFFRKIEEILLRFWLVNFEIYEFIFGINFW